MTPTATILTIDNGTSSTKAALWTLDGAVLAETSVAYTLQRPQPTWAEIDAGLWWRAACQACRDLLAQSGAPAGSVRAVAVDGISWTLLAVDQALRPLAPALIWLDRRAEQEAQELQASPLAQRLVQLSANPLDPAYITPKLLWLQRRQPAIFEQAAYFLTASGFLSARLCGQPSCDLTQAYGYHFYAMKKAAWDAEAARALGIPLEKLPPLRACSEIIGQVTRAAAAETGLAEGTPVLAGCLDAASGALGAGLTRLGQANEQGGQAGGMAISLDRVVVEPRLIFSPHVLAGQYLLQGGTVGGGSLGWLRDILGESLSFEQLSAEAAQAEPGAGGVIFLPYMAGERTPLWNSRVRGMFAGLSYSTSRRDLARAVMEGCALAVYHNIQVAAESGAVVDEYLGSGGATRSAVWCQIKADLYGKPFVLARRAGGGEGGHLLGLFALGMQAIGACDSAGGLVEQLLPERVVYEPDPGRHARYQEIFKEYMRLSQFAQ
jgi:xylulokinase